MRSTTETWNYGTFENVASVNLTHSSQVFLHVLLIFLNFIFEVTNHSSLERYINMVRDLWVQVKTITTIDWIEIRHKWVVFT